MSHCLSQDTLAFHLQRPGLVVRDMRHALVPEISSRIKSFRMMNAEGLSALFGIKVYDTMGHPDEEAIMFYLINHAMSILRQRVAPMEPLGDLVEVVKTYNDIVASRAVRMFFYLLLICTRESRHVHEDKSNKLWVKIGSLFGPEIPKFFSKVHGAGSTGAANALQNNPPETTLGNYTSYLSYLFHKGSFSSGYGGHAWGAVADVLREFSFGILSPEMMLDTAFTLAHNNGPIFNKGMMYDQYSPEIYKILDVQRSGQIPQLVNEAKVDKTKTKQVRDLYDMLRAHFPEEMGGYVDWFKVKALGGVKDYSGEQAKQKSKYGPSPFEEVKAAPPHKQSKAIPKWIKDLDSGSGGNSGDEKPEAGQNKSGLGGGMKVKGHLEIMPKVVVDIVENER